MSSPRSHDVPAAAPRAATSAEAGSAVGPRLLLRAAILVSALALAGRLLGFLRDVLIARFFGASAETDAFYVAWTVPETAWPLLVESAVVYAFVPLFVRAMDTEGSARAAVNRTLGPALVALGGISALIAFGAPLLVEVFAPGLEEHALATRATRVAAISVVALGVAGLFIAALRSREVFGVPASVNVFFNLAIIGSVLLFHGESGVFSAAIGIAVGGAAVVLVQLPSVVRNIGWPRLTGGSLDWGIRILLPFLPIALFVLLRHSQVYVERFLASLLDSGAISVLNYAERVAQVPLGFTIAIAIVSFPAIARLASRGLAGELRTSFERDLKLVTLLIVPTIAIAIAFAHPLIGLLFERGSFSSADTAATASTLQFYCGGLLGHALMAVAVLPVYGLGRRMALPVRSAALGVGATVVLAVTLVPVLEIEGVALASAVGAIVMAIHLLWRVHSSVLEFDAASMRTHLAKTVIAAAAAGGLAWLAAQAMPETDVIRVVGGGSLLILLYLGAARALGVEHLQTLLAPVSRALGSLVRPQGARR